MLFFIRKWITGWFAALVVLLFCLPLLLFGTNYYFAASANPVIAKGSGVEIKLEDFRRSLAELRQRYRDSEVPLPPDSELREQLLWSLIDGSLVLHHARESGMRISPEAVVDVIQNFETLQQDGVFDREAYNQVRELVKQRLGSDIEDNVRAELVPLQLQSAVTMSSFLLEDEVYAIARLNAEKRDFAYVSLSLEEEIEATEVEEDEVEQWYQQNQDKYQRAERIKLAYLELKTENLVPQIEVDEQELEAYYNGRSEQYNIDEKRRVSRLYQAVPVNSENAEELWQLARDRMQELWQRLMDEDSEVSMEQIAEEIVAKEAAEQLQEENAEAEEDAMEEAVAESEEDAMEQEAVAGSKEDAMEQEAVTESEEDAMEQEDVAESEEDAMEQEAVTESEEDAMEQEAVAESEEDAMEQEAVAESEDAMEQEDVTESEEDAMEQEAVAESEDAMEQEDVTESEEDAMEQEAVAESEDAMEQEDVTESEDAMEQEDIAASEDEAMEQEDIAESEEDAMEQEAVAESEDAMEQEAVAESEDAMEQEDVAESEDAMEQEDVAESEDAAAEELPELPDVEMITQDLLPEAEFVPEIAEVAFTMEVDAVSELVETADGIYIVRLDELSEGRVSTFDNSRDDAERDFRDERAAELYLELAETLATIAYENPDNLEDAAYAMEIELQYSYWLERGGGDESPFPFNDEKLLAAAFSDELMESGLNSDLLEFSPEHSMVIRISEHEEAKIMDLDEVQEQASDDLRRDLAASELRTRGERILLELRSVGADSATVAEDEGFSWEEITEAERDSDAAPRNVLREVFRMSAPVNEDDSVFLGRETGSGDYLLLRLDAVTVVADDSEIAQEEIDSIWQQYSSFMQRRDWGLFMKALREVSEVEIFQDRINEAFDVTVVEEEPQEGQGQG